MATVAVEPIVYAYQNEHGVWRVTGTRVSLDSVVYMYREGADAETIVRCYPSLSLEQTYGAIALYLRNRKAIDEYLEQQNARNEELRKECEDKNRDLLQRLRAEKARRAGSN